MTDIPQEAARRAVELWDAEPAHDIRNAFARYIAQVSDAASKVAEGSSNWVKVELDPFILPDPVDPLLIEARKVCGEVGSALLPPILGGGGERCELIAAGKGDGYYEEKIALAALKRGMELAGKQTGEPS